MEVWMNRVDKARIIDAHDPHWPTVWVWFGFMVLFFSLLGVLGWILEYGPVWATVPMVVVIAHVMHSHMLAFHEAGHGTLCPSRPWNEAIGLLIGTLSFQSLTAFRAVHQTHHNYLGTERDEELWPFVLPHVPLWVRRLVAFYELTLGITFTPILCLRTYFRRGSPVRGIAERRRVLYEYTLITLSWTAIISLVVYLHAWKHLLVLYVIPGVLAGSMHSVRKYSEHMGMLGSTVLSTTRSIVSPGPIGRLLSFSMFNILYHGVHHRYAKIPQARLPHFTELLEPTSEGDLPAYTTYRGAFLDMLRGLGNPRVGSQWLRPRAVALNSVPPAEQVDFPSPLASRPAPHVGSDCLLQAANKV
jgi:fatty acid desaturase